MKRISALCVVSGARALTTVHKSKLPSIEPTLSASTSLSKFYCERSEALSKSIAFVDGISGKEVSFQDAFDRTEKIAAALYRKYNIRHGDIVTFVSPNTVDYVSVFQGVLMLGAVISPLSPAYSADDIAKHVKLARSKLLISYTMFKDVTLQASASSDVPLFLADVPFELDVPLKDSEKASTGKDDLVVLPFSSGTTGLPKGVELTNKNMLANLFQFNSILEQRPEDVIMAVLPYFHIYGMLVVMMGPLSVGAKQVVVPRFNLQQYIDLMGQHKATTLYVAPPMLLEIKNRLEEFPSIKSMDHVRLIMSGAAPLTESLQRSIEGIFPQATVLQGYGLTETSPVLTVCRPDDKLFGSAGALCPDTEIRIVDVTQDGNPKDATDPPNGTPGEIWVRGPQVMRGYANVDNTGVFVDDWFRTGDIGFVNDNNLYITDRLKELIKCKGFQVAPAELESLIMTLPFVKDVVVFGVPTPDKHDECPVASVVLTDATPEQLESRKLEILDLIAKQTPSYKHLTGGVHLVKEIPKSLSGKVLRRVAKQQYEAEL